MFFARALVQEPELLLLDEPLAGVDALTEQDVYRLLRELVGRGVTVLFTTHILEVAERMASRIGLIRSGRLIAEGTLTQLRARYGADDSTLEDLFLKITEEAAGEAAARPAEEALP